VGLKVDDWLSYFKFKTLAGFSMKLISCGVISCMQLSMWSM